MLGKDKCKTYISQFFLHSSTDGHLAIISNAAMNMRVQIFFQVNFSFPLDIFPEVEFLDHMVVLF